MLLLTGTADCEDVKREAILDVLCNHATQLIKLHLPSPCQFQGSSLVVFLVVMLCPNAQTKAMAGAGGSQLWLWQQG